MSTTIIQIRFWFLVCVSAFYFFIFYLHTLCSSVSISGYKYKTNPIEAASNLICSPKIQKIHKISCLKMKKRTQLWITQIHGRAARQTRSIVSRLTHVPMRHKTEKFSVKYGKVNSFKTQFGSLAAQFGSFPVQFGVRKNTYKTAFSAKKRRKQKNTYSIGEICEIGCSISHMLVFQIYLGRMESKRGKSV